MSIWAYNKNTFNEDISQWDTSLLSSWDVSSITNKVWRIKFQPTSSFNQQLDSWDYMWHCQKLESGVQLHNIVLLHYWCIGSNETYDEINLFAVATCVTNISQVFGGGTLAASLLILVLVNLSLPPNFDRPTICFGLLTCTFGFVQGLHFWEGDVRTIVHSTNHFLYVWYTFLVIWDQKDVKLWYLLRERRGYSWYIWLSMGLAQSRAERGSPIMWQSNLMMQLSVDSITFLTLVFLDFDRRGTMY